MTIFVGNFDFAKNIEKPNEKQSFWLPQPAQNSLKMALSPAKMAQDRSKMTPRPAKTSLDQPKTAQEHTKIAPRPPSRETPPYSEGNE